MTILLEHPIFLEHRTGHHPQRAGHPESPERLIAIAKKLAETGLRERCTAMTPILATREQLERLHPAAYLDQLERWCRRGGGPIDADTMASPQSYEAAVTAVGAACQAVNAVLGRPDRTAFCLVRPPGHHALADQAMGFCLLGTIALAAEHAIRQWGLRRVLIIDWDVHHGNGTQDFFYDRDDVWYFSMHRSPLFPGTGAASETGTGRGLGATRNLPTEFGTPRADMFLRFHQELTDFAARCRPELVLISAGFDAHRLDPIGSLGWETEDYGHLTNLAREVASDYCDGRIVSVLEGGYHLEALADSVAVHLNEMLVSR